MAQPVWTLSVDLQAKTASFTTGLAEAARGARSSFQSIRDSAREGGGETQKSFINAQQALGVLTNSLRGDAENALADIIRELSHTGAVMAALPFAAVAGGILLAINLAVEAAAKIKEWREEDEKLTAEQTRFGTAVNESFNSLDAKLITAQQRAAELANNQLGALHSQLELIDHQSMAELVHQLETIAKAAEPVFKALQGHWYSFGIGSEGASHALEQFKIQYDSLLRRGKDKEASDLLAGTLKSAEGVLAAQKQMNASRGESGLFGRNIDYTAQFRAAAVLRAAGVSSTEKEIQAQEQLVDALQKQVIAEGKIAELKKLDSGNATKQTGNEESARRAAAAKQAAASQMAIAESALAADKSVAAAALEIQRATIQQRLDSDLMFAERDKQIKLTANQAEIAALDKSSKDYTNQLKGLHDKTVEIEAQHAASVAQLRSRASVEQSKKELTDYEQSQREIIAATQSGTAERVSVIEAAIQDAQALALEDTDFYRQLGSQRVEAAAALAQQEAKAKADAGREAADHAAQMAQLELQADMQWQAVRDSARRVSEAARIATATEFANRQFEIKRAALQQEQAALDTSSKDYENKLKALHNKEKELVQAHQNDLDRIKYEAVTQTNGRVLSSFDQFERAAIGGLTRTLMGYQSFAGMMNSLGSQVVGGMLQNVMLYIAGLNKTKPHDAAAAARMAYVTGMKLPFPANIIAAPVMAAGAFASVMAFANGGIVPGVGRGDTVPAVLTPGETVLPLALSEGLQKAANSGGFDQKPPITVRAHFAPTIHALDGDGVDEILDKHQEKFERHITAAIRKANN